MEARKAILRQEKQAAPFYGIWKFFTEIHVSAINRMRQPLIGRFVEAWPHYLLCKTTQKYVSVEEYLLLLSGISVRLRFMVFTAFLAVPTMVFGLSFIDQSDDYAAAAPRASFRR